MKVMHVQLFPYITGVQKVSLEEFKFNINSTEFALIIKNEGPFTEAAKKYGVRIFTVPSIKREISFLSDVAAFFSIYRIILKEKPDVVHTHSSKTGILGRFAAYFAGVNNIVHTVHGFGFPAASSRITKLIYFLAEYLASKVTNTLIVMNNDDFNFANVYFKSRKCNIKFIRNAVDLTKFFPLDLSRKITEKSKYFGTDKFVIGFVGRLDDQKNPLEFINAAKMILDCRSDAIFYIVGDGNLSENVRTTINNMGINQSILMLGWRHDVPDLLRATDILISTSLYEGMPLNILEGMASGSVIIASNVTGNRDLVTHKINGLLYPSGNVNELFSNLMLTLDSNSQREEFIKSSLLEINNNHTISKRLSNLDCIYKKNF